MVDFGSLPPEAKKFLNDLKCPLCGGAVDLVDGSRTTSKRKNGITGWHNLRCLNDFHYTLEFDWDELGQGIFGEKIAFVEEKTHYEVERYFANSIISKFEGVVLKAYPINGDGFIDREKKIFEKWFQGLDPFDFRSPINTKEAASRIWTILTFQ